ncbi:MAG: MmcQ/YjbR family DNA-binding protein [Candidatus Azobacteroides sp.]|nr:MmcQ/YjbR family DNA-binding protein [Candidatus Azobacteroides sp.]
MNIEEIREYCLSFKAVTEHFPFDEFTLVFKVMDKMFALIPLDVAEKSITLKCDPEKAVELRSRHDGVIPGYHFNKKYWNTVYITPDLSDKLLKEWISDSYDEVVKKFSKPKQKQLIEL